MKKLMLALIVAAVAMPALAQEVKAPVGKDAPAVEMQRDHEAFKKAREAHKAQMKATEEKIEKLVKEYNKLKPGKKKDAKRAEIAQELRAIHEKQLEFKKDQLVKFEERLSRMKAEFEKENSAEGRAEWVNQKTDALIAAEGDLKAVFGHPGMHRPHMGKDGECPCMGEKKDCPCKKGFMGKGPKGFGHKGPPGPRPDEPDFDD